MIKNVSIIIPTLNEETYLPILLKSLEEQTFKNFEIIVADAFSSDNTRNIAQSHGAKLANGGHISKSRNSGAKKAKASTLTFFDADVKISNDFLEKTLQEFVLRRLDIATTLFQITHPHFTSRLLYSFSDLNKLIWQFSPFPFGTGECIILKRKVFEDIGGFNEEKLVSNDVDFLRRAVKKGNKYRVLKTRILPSDRRMQKFGILRVSLGSFFGLLFARWQTKPKVRKLASKLYGGWAKW